MNEKFIKPNFSNNIINISATLAEFLGSTNDKPTLPTLARELKKGYKNVVFLILDGLGVNPINKNLTSDTFIQKNIKQILTSVFPSTTTNATTTFLTNKYPIEHGWLGWSLYFEDLKRAVDIFPETDSFTREPIEKGYVKKVLPVEPYYKGAVDYTTNVVVPKYWNNDYENRYEWKNFDELLDHIERICKKEGKQFIYSYCDEPDHTMHEYGVSSCEAKKVINKLNCGIEELYSRLSDTLFIISADHGQTDVDGYIELYKDEELISMLEWPQFLEARATAFKVKQNCHKDFIGLFNKKYGGDFELCKVEDLIADNFFGDSVNKNVKLLGDYIAIGKTNKIMKLTPLSHDFKGHHTSLTKEEMEVPLIFIGNKAY